VAFGAPPPRAAQAEAQATAPEVARTSARERRGCGAPDPVILEEILDP